MRNTPTLTLVNYEKKYYSQLKALTLEWLEKYLSVEPEDEKFIENPEEYVLQKGGFIYIALYNNEVIGTVSLYKVTAHQYELAKLAITEKYKGLGFGKALVEFAIQKAKSLQAKELVLYTTKRLAAAYNLYLTYGFVDSSKAQKYLESDSYMVLKLQS